MTTQPTPEQAFHDFEQAGWQRAAVRYAEVGGSLTGQFLAPLLDAAQVGPGTRVLDVATGPGFGAGAAAARGATAIGVDFAENMLAEARRRYPAATFRLGDAESLPFADGAFDAVICSFGLLHFARPERAVAEAGRMLRPGGVYAATVWDTPEHNALFAIALGAVQRHGDPGVPLPPGPPLFRFSDPDEFRRLLEGAGLADVQVTTVPGTFRLPAADDLYPWLLEGTARNAALLRAQTPAAQAAIRAAMRDGAAAYTRGGEVQLPMQAVLAAGHRPA